MTAILKIVRELPPETVSALAAELASSGSATNWTQLARFGSTHASKERIAVLTRAVAIQPEVDGRAVGLAIQASAHAVDALSTDQRVEIAWTGPGTEAVPLRRVDQVLYELIESAKAELLLVTYAAYKAERALDALRVVSERGVRVTLIIELAIENGGKLSFDVLDTIRDRIPRASIYFWPRERRTQNATGSCGAMHAKCLVVDRNAALVSSANLTDYALEMNMELGLVVHGAIAARLSAHFEQLILRGELVNVSNH